ncbi:MAG: phosphoribosylformylglycinamidine synthase [Chloroflexi bacterium]|jgi:phosphoribosylformylglycinamidine synthase PurS subunit|nr:MAG: phosphoribosylformylglycinamidine synthase [Chloroflexota bacterium]|tara:strand:- start:2370 stop:2624 length:255 start_codon:yes stop_codon:yes gene_type:complete
MNTYNISILIKLKQGVNDPQGIAIKNGLNQLGFSDVNSARMGKVIDLSLTANNEEDALSETRLMCDQLLSNPVIEDFSIQIKKS